MEEGNRWSLAQQAVSDVADIATKYDEDGVDVHFLNAHLAKSEGKHLQVRLIYPPSQSKLLVT